MISRSCFVFFVFLSRGDDLLKSSDVMDCHPVKNHGQERVLVTVRAPAIDTPVRVRSRTDDRGEAPKNFIFDPGREAAAFGNSTCE